jgi:stringent starvation protein B
MPDRLSPVPAKKQTLLAYLERGIAMLHLDARRPGVVVPKQYAHDPHLRLNLSYRYHIPDLVIDDARVQATLSFAGRPFQCVVPWEAIFGVTSQSTGVGQVWPEDLPIEVVEAVDEPEPRRKPSLAAVEDEEDAQEEPPSSKPKGPPHLRLVR